MPVAVNAFLKKSLCSVANLADRMGLRWEAHAEKLCKWLKIANLALQTRRQTAPLLLRLRAQARLCLRWQIADCRRRGIA